jgi:hypothetical protein
VRHVKAIGMGVSSGPGEKNAKAQRMMALVNLHVLDRRVDLSAALKSQPHGARSYLSPDGEWHANTASVGEEAWRRVMFQMREQP